MTDPIDRARSGHYRQADQFLLTGEERTWTAEKADFPDYDTGSDGPNAADELLARDGGRVWRKVTQLSEHKT